MAIRYPISLWLSGSEELAVGATGTVCLGGYPCRRSRRDRERTLSGRGNGYPDSEYKVTTEEAVAADRRQPL